MLKFRGGRAFRRRAILAAGAAVAGGGLALALATASFATTYDYYNVNLLAGQAHQGYTAANFPSNNGQCAGIPSTEDGWHFVAPNSDTSFITLHLTFTGGTIISITLTHNGQQALVATTPGAVLVDGNADVKTPTPDKHIKFFVLSDTCPAGITTPPSTTPPSTTPPSTTPPSTTPPTTTPPTTTPPGAPPPTPVPGNLPVTG